MIIEIKGRYTGLVIYSGDFDSVKDAVVAAVKEGISLSGASLRSASLSSASLSGADLAYADLSGASLRGASLRGASLRGADLRGADLRGASLRGADLRGASLRGSDLSGLDLSDADLRGADLLGADLASAKTDFRYIQIACIGSVKRMTTYCFETDTVYCGCFTGTLLQFEKQVKKEYADTHVYYKEYIGFIDYLKSLK